MNGTITVDYVISKLNEIFNVKDIASVLVTAETLDEAKKVHASRGFDRVPIKKKGKIDNFYDANYDKEIQVTPEYILSEQTGIFETLSYFSLSKRDFFFILNGNSINRIVHYSDLNNPLVSIGIYTQIAYCEIAIRNFARSKNPYKLDFGEKFLTDLKKSPGADIKIDRAKSRFENKKRSQTETDLFDELDFDEELILFREIIKSNLDANEKAHFEKFVNLEDSRIEFIKNMRNEVMHSKPEIIKKHSDINEWLKFLQDCQYIIRTIEDNTFAPFPR